VVSGWMARKGTATDLPKKVITRWRQSVPRLNKRTQTAHVWRELIPSAEQSVYRQAGFGARSPWGTSPSVIIVDVNVDFLGDRREPLLQAIRRYPLSCGETGWDALPRIDVLAKTARAGGHPVVYTTSQVSEGDGGSDDKFSAPRRRSLAERRAGAAISNAIAPDVGDLVLAKSAPSGFWGTELHSYLQKKTIDTVVICGCATSGCVRATVVDAFSYGYRVVVPEQCCFDRARTPHLMSFFDIEQKYGDVVNLEEACAYLTSVPPRS